MTPAELAKAIADTTSTEMQAKFMKGQAEHGGDLRDRPMVAEIRAEVLDLAYYSNIIKMHQDEIIESLHTFKEEFNKHTRSSTQLNAFLDLIVKQVEKL